MWNQNDKVEIENAIQYACSDVRNWTFLEVGASRTIVYRKLFVDALKARGEDFQFFSLVTNQEKYFQVEEMYREEENVSILHSKLSYRHLLEIEEMFAV